MSDRNLSQLRGRVKRWRVQAEIYINGEPSHLKTPCFFWTRAAAERQANSIRRSYGWPMAAVMHVERSTSLKLLEES